MPPTDDGAFNFSSTIITSLRFGNINVRAYADVRRPRTYYVEPAFVVKVSEQGSIDFNVDGNHVVVTFLCYTDQMLSDIASRISTKENLSPALTTADIIPLPIREVLIQPEWHTADGPKPKAWNMSSDSGVPGSGGVKINQEMRVAFECNNSEIAHKLADRIRKGNQIFGLTITSAGVRVSEFRLEINIRQFSNISWSNLINPNSDDVSAANQFFTINQIADSFGVLLNQIGITTRSSADMDENVITEKQVQEIAKEFIDRATEEIALELKDVNTDIFIGRTSFEPDIIKKESKKIADALSVSFQIVTDELFKKFRNGENYNLRDMLTDAFKKSTDDKVINGSAGGSVGIGALFSGSAKADFDTKFSDSLEQKMKEESKRVDSTKFSDSVEQSAHQELRKSLTKSSQSDWSFEGQVITPKRFRLLRVNKEKFNKDFSLFRSRQRLNIGSLSYSEQRSSISTSTMKGEPASVVFSAEGTVHKSEGPADGLLEYASPPHVNKGNAWDGTRAFIAPVAGIYYFSVYFMKRAFEEGIESADDVKVFLKRNGAVVLVVTAGEDLRQGSSGRIYRQCASKTIAFHMDAGDRVDTWVNIDGRLKTRFIDEYGITGFLISAGPN